MAHYVVPALALILAADLSFGSRAAETAAPAAPPRAMDFAQLARGAELYAQHCAQCHGQRAEGHPGWRQRDADDRFRPPPLDGTGHGWHHPHQVLVQRIKYGGPPDQSTMPAFAEVLSDRQIDDIIAWFQSLWPDEIYRAWHERDQRVRQGAPR